MRDYELLFIVKTTVSEEDTQSAIDRYTEVLTNYNAEIKNIDKWGKRRLAYTIDKHITDGYYVLVTFKGNEEAVNEVDRLMKIDERILRHLVTRAED